MLESYAFYVILAGLAIGAIGWVWLTFRAFHVRSGWGWALVLFPPAAIVFVAQHFFAARAPARLLLTAAMVVALPFALSYYERHFLPLEPFEQLVDGQLRITLTGLEKFDYAKLRQKPTVVVLQMANSDVTDQTLEHLRGLERLSELDLNGTQVTDQGLATVAALPKLTTLRLARTPITDEGFRQHLMPKDSLKKLDLTGVEVKSKTKREWKNLQSEVREYVD